MGSRGTLFYNTTASPLPGSAAPQLRAGVNRWEAQVTLDMQRAQGLELPASDWWCAELELDEVCTTRCDSVLQALGTSAYCRGSCAALEHYIPTHAYLIVLCSLFLRLNLCIAVR